ncbi:MAG: hypothetical protein KDK24_14615 [Pseudooceanicola sp.]|nr:hypothetical protein [Pseudooceanicola sp.]
MTDPLVPLIQNLHAQGRLRAWSLIITVFGDMVQHRGGAISSGRLGQLLGRVGVEAGTMRTAISRLGQDGWITGERRGRSSDYRLRPDGLERFAPATARIYAPPPGPVSDWALTVSLTGSGPELRIAPASEAEESADLRVEGRLTALSEAYRAHLLPAAYRAALAGLAHDLRALDVPLPDPLDAAAARMLLIHRWRRIVLRYPDLPPALMPADAPLADPRRAVADAYRRIAPLAETWLDVGEDALPPAAPAFLARFGGLQQA